MDSLLEDMRRMHEERERLIDTMVREWLHDKKTHKEKINSEHRIKRLLDRYMAGTKRLADLYADGDGSRAAEIGAVSGPAEFDAFYNRLKSVKETHKRAPDEVAVPLSAEFQDINTMIDDAERVEADMVVFSDEEGYGRFLDMYHLHNLFMNLKHVQKVDYIKYLDEYDNFSSLQMDTKKSAEYRRYLDSLFEYLAGFIARTCPLLDLGKELTAAVDALEKQWLEGSVPGWPRDDSIGALVRSGAPLDLDDFSSVQQLEALGLDRLKSALVAAGLKCGGTAAERAERLFSTKGVPREQWPQTILAKSSGKKSGGLADKMATDVKRKATATMEAKISHLGAMLSDTRSATRENVTRKQARTGAELDVDALEEEDADAALADDDDDDNESDMPYNPKNLPLGWDGKPIPYWLYKLHGLNISYACEICGNQTYKGPKTFQRHFSEWRHSQGMRCLGIPNTSHFANITKIQDACNLWQKLREQKKLERFNPEIDEEYEDSIGNVVNKKTFEDLKRQGLL